MMLVDQGSYYALTDSKQKHYSIEYSISHCTPGLSNRFSIVWATFSWGNLLWAINIFVT